MTTLGLSLGINRNAFLGAPSLELNFSTGLALPGTVAFSRASSASYFDSAGVLQSATTNTPRFGYLYNGTSWVSRGLLIEAQRTNSSGYTEDFGDSSWTKLAATVTTNQIAAPDGATTADLFVESTANDFHQVFRSISATPQFYTFSVFVKWKTGTTRNIYLGPIGVGALGNNRHAVFDSTGSFVAFGGGGTGSDPTYSIQNCGNGWFRIAVTAQCTGTGTATPYIGLTTGSSFSAYAGDGSSGVYLWGAQFGNGADVSSYIPNLTTGTTTRSADVATISGSDFTSFFNASEGTVLVEGVSFGIGTKALVAFDDNTANESIILRTNGTDPIFEVVDGGVSQCSLDGGTITAGTAFKFAGAYKANDFAACLNGGTVQTDTGGTIPTVDRLRLGVDQAGNYLNGYLSRVRYWTTRLTNAQLQELTT